MNKLSEFIEIAEDYLDGYKSKKFLIYWQGRYQISLIQEGKKYNHLNSNIAKIFHRQIPLANGQNYNTAPLALAYIKAYEEGETEFDKLFNVNNDTFWNHSEKIVATLKQAYFFRDPFTQSELKYWKKYVTYYTCLLNEEIASEYGRYAGAISKLRKLISIYTPAFKNFYDIPQAKKESLPFKKTEPIIALYHFYTNQPITQDNKESIGSKYQRSGHSLYQAYNEWKDETKRIRKNDVIQLKTRIGYFDKTLLWLKGEGKDEACSSLINDLDKLKKK